MVEDTRTRSSARDILLETAVQHLATRGPIGVHPQEICAELGMSKALVNYHFGSREGLVVEAMVVGYERYVDTLWQAAEAAGADPVERLLAWTEAQVRWTSEHHGLAAALDFPDATIDNGELPAGLEQRLNDAGSRNFANLQLLVLDARTAVKSADPTWQADPTEVGLTSAAIGWLTLGQSVWLAGNHLPTRRERVQEMLPMARAHVRTLIMEMLAR